MNRISPRMLGFVVVLGGACAAFQFQKPASHQAALQPASNSEAIEWRSNDFTLEVTGSSRALSDSHGVDDRPKSPAFGDAEGASVSVRASLDQAAQPPSLADAYTSATTAPLSAALGAAASGGLSTRSREPAGDAYAAAKTPLASVAVRHTITDGDTLEALAEKHLGSRLRWTEIYNSNPEILDDPEVLPVGVTIVILPGIQPSISASTSSTSTSETESLVPVSRSDLRQFRQPINENR